MTAKLRVGCVNTEQPGLQSSYFIIKNFLGHLSGYVDLFAVDAASCKDLESKMSSLAEKGMDFFYVDDIFILQKFLIRERLGWQIPFIFTLHSLYYWASDLSCIIPLIRPCDVVISPSDYTKEAFARITGKIKVSVIPHCLDVNSLNLLTQSCSKYAAKSIGFLGRLVPEKGLCSLIDAMKLVLDEIKDAHLNVIGQFYNERGTEIEGASFENHIHKKISSLGLEKHVSFKGRLIEDQKFLELAKHHLFVNPTVAPEESFGMVNIEALSCGIPVIASDWAANREIIKTGNNGEIVPLRASAEVAVDVRLLANAIVNVLKSSERLSFYSMGARESRWAYDISVQIPRLVRILELGRAEKQKQKAPLGSWSEIKNSAPVEFAQCFNRDFLFFLRANRRKAFVSFEELYSTELSEKKWHWNNPSHGSHAPGVSYEYLEKIKRDWQAYITLREPSIGKEQ